MLKLQELVEAHIYSTQESSFRYHLGASLLGADCERAIWYGYRWFKEVSHEARIVRLFDRGEREEAVVLNHLRAVGVNVHAANPNTGKQYRLSALGGHLGGGLDAILSDVPDLRMRGAGLFECKTANQKSYDTLVKQGLRQNKTQHYVQMQIYMRAYNLEWGLYICVCKNTDDWYWEFVEYDGMFAENYMQRGANIIASSRAPMKLNNNPAYFQCKWCDYREICHYDEAPAKNCRTCIHSTPGSDGRWHCELLPTRKIRTKEEAEEKGKPLNHMPCSGLRYEVIK